MYLRDDCYQFTIKKTDVNGKKDGSTVFAVQGAGEIPRWKDSTQYIVKTK